MKNEKRKTFFTFYLFSFLFIVFSLFSFTLHAQEAPAAEVQAEGEPAKKEVPMTPERRRLEREIITSSLPELAAWSRTLGLSEGGTREELAKRLREHFELPEPKQANTDNQKTITIESAQSTEYFKIEIVDEDYARLKGDVRIIVRDKDSVHHIKAGEILFNRTRNILTAKGGVEYTRDKDDTTEIFRGENITVNIDDWSSIFLAGDSEKKLESEDTAYRFTGTVISRTDEDVMILNNAQVSNAKSKEKYWSITASKLWLLPGSDFAIFNAWLRVGEIPVLYIPVFYFPADEVIFHPVIGYRSREGGFIQTTTYIIGRPKANPEEQSSLSRILGNASDMEKEPNGLFLRSTGKKIKDPNNTSFKVMADYYTNLGVYLGTDLTIPNKGILNSLDFSMGVGFTRTLTLISGNYTPYAPDFDGSVEWNESNLFSMSVPFRYRMKANTGISGKYGSATLNMPYYSDPYVDRDFLVRSESMDWVNMMQQGAAMEEEAQTAGDIGTYQWQLNGSLRPTITALSPYISSLSLSSMSMTMAFKTIEDKEISGRNREHPGRFFYVPDKYTIYSFSGSVAGTPLTIGGTSTAQTNTTGSGGATEEKDPFNGMGVPRSPWTKEEDTAAKTPVEDKLAPPVLSQRFDLPAAGRSKFSIDYSLAPTGSSELQFMSGYDRWKSFDQVNWGEVQSVLSSFGGNASVSFHFDYNNSFFTNVFTLSGSGTWRDYTYLNDEAEAFRTPQTSEGEKDEERIKAAKRQQYSQTNYSTSYSYTGTLRPFSSDPVFGQTNFQYAFRGTLVRSKRYIDGDEPELTPQWGGWVKEKTGEDIFGLTVNKVSANLAANVMDKQQNLTLSFDIPPLDPVISTNGTFRVWISETNARIDFKKPELIDNEPNDDWKIDPFHLTETLKLWNFGSATFYMVLAPEENNEITTITSSLTLWDFKASFSAVKSLKYEFVFNEPGNIEMGGAWKQKTEEEPALNPRDLTFTYIKTFPKKTIIKKYLDISANVNSRLFFDLQRHTNSNFQLSLGLTLNVTNFLDLTFSATSENAVIFRYFKNIPGFEEQTAMYKDGDQNNFFIDLFDSFNFGDESKRQRSGFKMKRFSLSATHHLGDWKATLDIAMSPYLNTDLTSAKYEINADISFLIQWTAISEIKSDIKYEKKTDRWIVK